MRSLPWSTGVQVILIAIKALSQVFVLFYVHTCGLLSGLVRLVGE